MKIETLIEALEDARKRGLETASVILNTSHERFCSVGIEEVCVSDLTGCVIYLDGYNKDFIGFLKDHKK